MRLLANGPDACAGELAALQERRTPYGTLTPGGYHNRKTAEYDEELCLDPKLVVGFVQATQPQEWAKLRKQYGDRARQKFLKRLSKEIAKRGTLDVLRKGIKDMGAKIQLVYFKPPTGLNPALQKKYRANTFSVIRQFAYSPKDKDKDIKYRKKLDLGLFLNGLPLFTVELKNPLTGQTYRNAIRQYQTTRSDAQEPLFAFGAAWRTSPSIPTRSGSPRSWQAMRRASSPSTRGGAAARAIPRPRRASSPQPTSGRNSGPGTPC